MSSPDGPFDLPHPRRAMGDVTQIDCLHFRPKEEAPRQNIPTFFFGPFFSFSLWGDGSAACFPRQTEAGQVIRLSARRERNI
jgi:hypothetical protein